MELILQALSALSALATVADFALTWVIPAIKNRRFTGKEAATDSAEAPEKE